MPPPRLSRKEATVLNLLTSRGDSYGLELVRASDGELKRGTVYVTLDRMEDKGLIESWTEDAAPGQQGPPRRKYRATGHGAAALSTWCEQLAVGFSGLRLASHLGLVLPVALNFAHLQFGVALAISLFTTLYAIRLLNKYLWANKNQNRRATRVNNISRQIQHYEISAFRTTSDREKYRLNQLIDGGHSELSALAREGKIVSWVFGADTVVDILSPNKPQPRAEHTLWARRKTKRVRLVPGARVARLFRFLPKKMVARRLDPMYRDFIDEYMEALKQGDAARARALQFWFYVGLFGITAGSIVGRGLGHVIKEVRESLQPSESA